MNLHWIDLAILGVIALSMVTGFVRGFVKEVVALCVWVASLWIAFHYYKLLDPYLASYITDMNGRKVASFLIFFLGSLILGGLFNALLTFILKRTGLSGTDRVLGMVFGFGRGVFIISLVMMVVKVTVPDTTVYSKESQFYDKFNPIVLWINTYTPDVLHQIKVVEKANLDGLIDLTSDLEEG